MHAFSLYKKSKNIVFLDINMNTHFYAHFRLFLCHIVLQRTSYSLLLNYLPFFGVLARKRKFETCKNKKNYSINLKPEISASGSNFTFFEMLYLWGNPSSAVLPRPILAFVRGGGKGSYQGRSPPLFKGGGSYQGGSWGLLKGREGDNFFLFSP